MFAAASRKGGAGGVSQSVGKEFANADPGGRLPEHVKAKPEARYAKGGAVHHMHHRRNNFGAGQQPPTGGLAGVAQSPPGGGQGSYPSGMSPGAGGAGAGVGTGAAGGGAGGGAGGMTHGGRIQHVHGKPEGKDDGLIAAQRGEFVVRKSAVKKLGEKALEEINRGHLPKSKAADRYKRKAA